METLKRRIDFIYMFDVQDGNPNGDPDAGNLPRVDFETDKGLVTDVCIKRKIRNYVDVVKSGIEGYDIFIREGAVLNTVVDKIYETPAVKNADKNQKKVSVKNALCEKYYDIRTFGAVIASKEKQGQVRGPVQLTFARSVDSVRVYDHTITCMSVTKADKEKEHSMGRKATVPYGLYVAHGFISANLAKQTGFSEEDLELFWNALENMFDLDRSAARGLMAARKLIIFEHETELGNARADKLFDTVTVSKKNEVTIPRSFLDYDVTIDRSALPEGVKVYERI
ncbi:type I-C CRISPR-associated protein Cas7/Csd2 [Lepagella muris]|jgi:CRISPR-associated protein Csd2|uniref:Type I-C CRISPR-associated protein Cas7/Csd2 n=1 Tax=Lepagella muris TaxID=3032870 RepID=A0AC61RBJ3_9BACT|nr:type I-C CRISPR-associated protein Cas7/Csd2 [Lepagella muris]ROT09197.1 type I-C CRISPR-associated protein Cas7/Csd2 [Muribaculaceae bacterium Isolate-037 (Harlan)]TGY76653.1 type I-C CRISPR-associated protein Cas7/Csd2 [Lepagella muris]THG48203.1 type I-C CRISPR-associated protein Cas7/Csd2 [Bacteroidales bacterium]TKC54375.1 type I-C CRISPR-associated protein Cas7/Csd2 [Bacteroidales bacterium]